MAPWRSSPNSPQRSATRPGCGPSRSRRADRASSRSTRTAEPSGRGSCTASTRGRARRSPTWRRASGPRPSGASAGWPCPASRSGPKIAWVVRHEPAVARQVATWHTATSFIVARLTGVAVLDRHQASYVGPLYDLRRHRWDERYADALPLAGRLPDLGWPGDVAGGLTDDAARRTGLAPGTPVLVGTSDGPMEALALGARTPGTVALTHGSTTTVDRLRAGARRGDRAVDHRRLVRRSAMRRGRPVGQRAGARLGRPHACRRPAARRGASRRSCARPPTRRRALAGSSSSRRSPASGPPSTTRWPAASSPA